MQRSLAILDSLTQESSVPILNYLLHHQHATFPDLLIHSRLDAPVLEEQLEVLCGMKILVQREYLYQTVYELNRQRLRKITSLASVLGRRG